MIYHGRQRETGSSGWLFGWKEPHLVATACIFFFFDAGIVESTGMTTQVRTSYLPAEILWGHRLAPLLTYQKENGQYRIDYTQFHAVEPIKMPECSARALATEARRSSAAGDSEDDHLPVYFTAPAVKLTSSAPSGRLSVFRRMRGSVQRRRNRSRRDAVSTSLTSGVTDVLPGIDDSVKAQPPALSGDDANKSLPAILAKDVAKNNNNNKFVRSISFA